MSCALKVDDVSTSSCCSVATAVAAADTDVLPLSGGGGGGCCMTFRLCGLCMGGVFLLGNGSWVVSLSELSSPLPEEESSEEAESEYPPSLLK